MQHQPALCIIMQNVTFTHGLAEGGKNWEPRSIPRVGKIERASSLPFHSQNSTNVSRQQFWASNIIIISLVLFKLRARVYCTESTHVQRRGGRLGKKAPRAHTWNLTRPKRECQGMIFLKLTWKVLLVNQQISCLNCWRKCIDSGDIKHRRWDWNTIPWSVGQKINWSESR